MGEGQRREGHCSEICPTTLGPKLWSVSCCCLPSRGLMGMRAQDFEIRACTGSKTIPPQASVSSYTQGLDERISKVAVSPDVL